MRRSAVTGVGVVAPGGVNREAFWETITSGRTATRKITFFDPSGFRSQIAAEADFDPSEAGLDDQEANRMDRYVQFAVAAAIEAVNDAGLEVEAIDRERLAVTLGSAVGGTMILERDYVVVSNHGEKWLVDHEYATPFLYNALVPSALAAEVALRFGAQGPSVVVSTGCTSGHRRNRLRPPADPGRRGGHRHLRRIRDRHLPDLDGVLRPDQGDVTAERRPRARLAAVRPRPRRVRHGGGGRHPRARRARVGARTRRARLLRGRGVREPRQRLPHDRSPAGRRGDGRGDPRRHGPGEHRSPRTSTTSTRTARGRSRTTATRPLRTSVRSATRPTRSRSARSSR